MVLQIVNPYSHLNPNLVYAQNVMGERYTLELKFLSTKPINWVLEQLTKLANKLKGLINDVLINFHYKVIGLKFRKQGNYVFIDINMIKIGSPQLVFIVIAILAAIGFILHGLGLVFQGYALIKQQENKAIEQKTVNEVVNEANKLYNSKRINLQQYEQFLKVISKKEQQTSQKSQTLNIAESIENIVKAIIAITVIIYFLPVIIKGITKLINKVRI